MPLVEIDHVAIAVKDLEAAIDYYRRAFGAEVDHREVVESDGVEEALLKVAESYVQLLTPTRDDSPVAKAIEKRGEGLHHVGYRVKDCGAALASMIAAGATPIDNTNIIFPNHAAADPSSPMMPSPYSATPDASYLDAIAAQTSRTHFSATLVRGVPR